MNNINKYHSIQKKKLKLISISLQLTIAQHQIYYYFSQFLIFDVHFFNEQLKNSQWRSCKG